MFALLIIILAPFMSNAEPITTKTALVANQSAYYPYKTYFTYAEFITCDHDINVAKLRDKEKNEFFSKPCDDVILDLDTRCIAGTVSDSICLGDTLLEVTESKERTVKIDSVTTKVIPIPFQIASPYFIQTIFKHDKTYYLGLNQNATSSTVKRFISLSEFNEIKKGSQGISFESDRCDERNFLCSGEVYLEFNERPRSFKEPKVNRVTIKDFVRYPHSYELPLLVRSYTERPYYKGPNKKISPTITSKDSFLVDPPGKYWTSLFKFSGCSDLDSTDIAHYCVGDIVEVQGRANVPNHYFDGKDCYTTNDLSKNDEENETLKAEILAYGYKGYTQFQEVFPHHKQNRRLLRILEMPEDTICYKGLSVGDIVVETPYIVGTGIFTHYLYNLADYDSVFKKSDF